MDNSFFDSFYFAEFILTIGSLIILIISLFLKKNVFERTSLLAILLLLFVSFIVIKDTKIFFASYNDFFKTSNFIIFFKLLTIYGSITSIIISINYCSRECRIVQQSGPLLFLCPTVRHDSHMLPGF